MKDSPAKSKVWYQKWWGIVLIVLIILFFPLVLLVILPYLAWTKTKWHRWTKIALSVIFGFFLLAILGSNTTQKTAKINNEQVIREVKTEPKKETGVIFDIETLHGKNIDETITLLGASENNPEPTDKQKELGITKWDKTFKKGNYNLFVTYKLDNRTITELFISLEKTKREDGLTTKEEIQNLKESFNIKENGNYAVEMMKAQKENSFFTGIKLIPKQIAERMKKIEKQFSAWDGKHIALARMIQENLKDPESFKHVETRYEDKGDYILVSMQYRGTNSFWAVMTEYANAKFTIDGDFIELVK